MNSHLLGLAILEIVIAVIISVIIIYASYSILKRLFFRGTDLKQNNMAFIVFTSGIILSVGIILSEIIPSITNVIRLSMSANQSITITDILLYSGLYLIIGFVFAVIINFSVFVLFSTLTKGINEFKDIQQNNIGTSILVVAILIAITLILKDSISLLISALIPYPETTNFL